MMASVKATAAVFYFCVNLLSLEKLYIRQLAGGTVFWIQYFIFTKGLTGGGI